MKINLMGQVDAWMLSDLSFILDYVASPTEDLDLYINSLGGSVVAGQSIYSRLKRHEGKVTAYIEGFAGSMMSIIPLAADEIVISTSGVVMLHNPLTTATGNTKELEVTIEMLEKVKDSMVARYVEKFNNKTEDEIIEMMDKTTWLNAKEALELGFADRLESEQTEATAGYMKNEYPEENIVAHLTNYDNIPEDIKNKFNLGGENITENKNTIGGLTSMKDTKDKETSVEAADLSAADTQAVADAAAEARAAEQNRVKSITSTFTANGLKGHAKMTDLLLDGNAGELEAVKACNEILIAKAKEEKPSLADEELAKNAADAAEIPELTDVTTVDTKTEESTLNMSAFSEGFKSVSAIDMGE